MAAARMSVVIPAHQEESVVGRCLDALHDTVPEGLLEVVVVANGCTDRTAEVARAHPSRPRVVKLARGSKHAALNAGDAEVHVFPRVYLDADVVLGSGAVQELLRLFTQPDVHAAAPRVRFDTDGRPWLVRSYYRTWQRLPFLNGQPIGNGVYALSAAGRARFGPFPAIIADDLFVLRHFAPAERRVLGTADFVVQVPWRVTDLLAVRTRAYLGTKELAEWDGGRLAGGRVSRVRSLHRLLRDVADVPDVLTYVALSTLASVRAGRRWRRGQTAVWDRDASTRRVRMA